MVGGPYEDRIGLPGERIEPETDREEHRLLGTGIHDHARSRATREVGRLRQVGTQDGHALRDARRFKSLEDRLEDRGASEGEENLLPPHPPREAGGRHVRGEARFHFFLGTRGEAGAASGVSDPRV